MSPEEMVARLEPFFAAAAGAEAARIEGFRTLTGGAVRSAFALDLHLSGPGVPALQELVLLAFRPGGASAFGAPEEFGLLGAVHDLGAPVPRPVYVGEDALERPFYVMERIPGESIGRRIVTADSLVSAREVLPRQLATALASIHRVDLSDPRLNFLARPEAGHSAAEHTRIQLDTIYEMVRVEAHPVFDEAFRWLAENPPREVELALVHGDFRIGNVLVGADGLQAVLDWELAHVGDPVEDLGWLCGRSWRFGVDHKTCGGVGSREDFLVAYREASGRSVSPEDLLYWEVFGNLRWGIFTLVQARPFLDGQSRNIELGMIGRRVAETEWELLNLMEGKAL
jgi:aminoglycoside phosphotransferase (APT) family kinase protein